jgi:plastocyanin
VSRFSLGAIAATLLLAACGGKDPAAEPAGGAPAASAAATAPPAAGRTIEVHAVSDEKGNRFEPSKVEAKPGDVLKFTLVSGVHNVSWPADKNPSSAKLPDPSEMLQLPGQTLEIPVTFPKGEYHWQCDPHAALGMVGELEVE